MAAYLSASWVEEIDRALSTMVVPEPGPEAALSVSGGRFTLVEEVRSAPGGDVRLALTVADGGARLAVVGRGDSADEGDEPVPDVTVALDYETAAALSAGTLTPAQALNDGKIRVRGDLSVLVAGEELLAAARDAVAGAGGGAA